MTRQQQQTRTGMTQTETARKNREHARTVDNKHKQHRNAANTQHVKTETRQANFRYNEGSSSDQGSKVFAPKMFALNGLLQVHLNSVALRSQGEHQVDERLRGFR